MKKLVLFVAAAFLQATLHAAETDDASFPLISPDEPIAAEFSAERAARYLDRAAVAWQKTHACTACHTMIPYMMARPALAGVLPPTTAVREFFEEVAAGKREAMPNYACHDVEGAATIGVAAALALNDRFTTGTLHPLTRRALDRMWTLQPAEGGWTWPFRDTPPFKVDEHYGVTLAAIAAGMAPDNYAATPAARIGLARVRQFLKRTPAVTLHQRTMVLWASEYVSDLLTSAAQAQSLAALMEAQRPDGGWSIASLVDNTLDPALTSERVNEARSQTGYGTEFLVYLGPERAYRSSLASDGYATGLAIFVARQAGVPARDARLARGIAWLKTHQRASGGWFTPSQAWHTRHLISNAGTGYAVLALSACGELPPAR